LLGALLFGVVEALSYHAQALNLPISSYFLQAMPYIFTVIVLGLGAGYSRRQRLGAPASLGLFWQRG
jgi:simple sugar transport system permease protein